MIKSNSFNLSICLKELIAIIIILAAFFWLGSHPSINYFTIDNSRFIQGALFHSLFDSFFRLIVGVTISISFGFISAVSVFELVTRPRSFIAFFLIAAVTPSTIWGVSAIFMFGISYWMPCMVVFLSMYFLITGLYIDLFSKIPNDLREIISDHKAPLVFRVKALYFRENINGHLLFFRASLFLAWTPLLAAETLGASSGLGNILLLGKQIRSLHLILGTWFLIVGIAFFNDCFISTIFKLLRKSE